MDSLITGWGVQDRRSLFVGAYRSMSVSMLTAIDANEFDDSEWVNSLLTNFVEYYFHAVDAFEEPVGACPEVWRVAFDAAADDQIHPLRVLFLGINAHINYDLALCVADVMGDWNEIDPDRRHTRRSDYEMVDTVIRRTVDSVQDNVVAPVSPTMATLDRLLGPIDEWLFGALITGWRRDTWADAISLLTSTSSRIGDVRLQIETEALDNAERIITIGPD